MSEPHPVDYSEYTNKFPPVWNDESLREQIASRNQMSKQCVVALDDDPTGTQTVHDVSVVTNWEINTIRQALAVGDPALYILTNSRSLTLPEAKAVNEKIASNLIEAAWLERRPIMVVSRSDSTLRGHFPGEVEALSEVMAEEGLYPIDGVCIIPFFPEGGRYTADDVHWVLEGDKLIPAAQTPYARDSVFGYSSSHLPSWVEEKTIGRVPAASVNSISLEHLRIGGPDQVQEILESVEMDGVVIVNALDYRDLEVFVLGAIQAERTGKRFLYRTAASFIKVAAGIEDRPLITKKELVDENNLQGGLIIFGSHVPKSNAQLKALRAVEGVVAFELSVRDVLREVDTDQVLDQLISRVNESLEQRQDTVIYTSRKVVLGLDAESTLDVGKQVSSALAEVVKGIANKPKYVIAKGGITSSDVASQGLDIRTARVMGQVIPGVPVWQTGQESRWPGLSYVVFPGNVGDDDAVAQMVRMLR